MVILQAYQIGHTYRYHQVLCDISFALSSGDCFALFGANGAGKTTLLKIFATLLKPTYGRFEIMQKDVYVDREEARRHLFFIGQETFLYDDLTIQENLKFALGLHAIQPTSLEIRRTLDRVGIGPYANQKSRCLSTGMQKRLALAKALLARFSLLLLDEPYTALDENGAGMMNDCIHEFLLRGAAVLMSSHDRVMALQVAQRAGILQNKALSERAQTPLEQALV